MSDLMRKANEFWKERRTKANVAELCRQIEISKSQEVIDVEWSNLSSDMEDEVLEKYRIKESCWSRYTGMGRPVQWIYKKVRQEECKAEDQEGKECLVAFVTCKQIVSEGKNPARDGVRSRLLLKIVAKIHNLSKYHEEHLGHCQEVATRMKEGKLRSSGSAYSEDEGRC